MNLRQTSGVNLPDDADIDPGNALLTQSASYRALSNDSHSGTKHLQKTQNNFPRYSDASCYLREPVVWRSSGKYVRKRIRSSVEHWQTDEQIICQLELAKLPDLLQHQVKVHFVSRTENEENDFFKVDHDTTFVLTLNAAIIYGRLTTQY